MTPWVVVALAGWALAAWAFLGGRIVVVFDPDVERDPDTERALGLLALTLEETSEILGRRVTREGLYLALEEIKGMVRKENSK